MTKIKLTSVWLAACLALPAVVALTGCKTSDRGNRTSGQYMDDKALTEKVSSALERDPQYKLETVEVSTFGGNVQLSGWVNTQEQKNRAGDIARGVAGVRQVENNISIKPNLTQTH